MEANRMKHNIYNRPKTLRLWRSKPLGRVFIGTSKKAYRTFIHVMLHSFLGDRETVLEKQAGPVPEFCLNQSYEDRATLGSDPSAYDSRKAGRGAVHFPWPSPVPFCQVTVGAADVARDLSQIVDIG